MTNQVAVASLLLVLLLSVESKLVDYNVEDGDNNDLEVYQAVPLTVRAKVSHDELLTKEDSNKLDENIDPSWMLPRALQMKLLDVINGNLIHISRVRRQVYPNLSQNQGYPQNSWSNPGNTQTSSQNGYPYGNINHQPNNYPGYGNQNGPQSGYPSSSNSGHQPSQYPTYNPGHSQNGQLPSNLQPYPTNQRPFNQSGHASNSWTGPQTYPGNYNNQPHNNSPYNNPSYPNQKPGQVPYNSSFPNYMVNRTAQSYPSPYNPSSNYPGQYNPYGYQGHSQQYNPTNTNPNYYPNHQNGPSAYPTGFPHQPQSGPGAYPQYPFHDSSTPIRVNQNYNPTIPNRPSY